ncbi:hypothetical protein POTOM_037718 [Populus tomentosa]|uniref:Uncharacterized protein n=1 Tax=Populus tomentosa TaxID=118781 RepID=A0A8X7YR13_POPTO|nr:hypothetical protein POTOM_037718 [Populus tomentosa]
MSSLGTSKGILEIAKFGVYVTVPVVLMYAFANNTKNLQKFMGNDLVEMESFEFRLEDKRFPPQQLEMALSEQNPETEVHKEGGKKRRADPRGNFVEAFIHSVPIKDSKTSITRGDEGKGSRIGSQEGYSLMLTRGPQTERERQRLSVCQVSDPSAVNVSNQVTGSEIMVQVASLRPINAEKTICSCKKANDMVRYPAFSDEKNDRLVEPFCALPSKAFSYIDKGILDLIYDTLLRARALP